MLLKYNLIRHAEREKVTEDLGKALLTEKGKRDAEDLGRKLSSEITEKTIITSSPFKRAYQTAFHFQRGAGKGKLIKVEEITEESKRIKKGYFAKWYRKYDKEFFDQIIELNAEDIHKRWLEENSLKNTMKKEECVERDVEKIKELEEKNSFDKIIIFTHDTVIVYFWHYFYNELIENPGLLEGIGSNNLKEWKFLELSKSKKLRL